MTVPGGPWRTGVRVYECDSLGHANNAWYLAYLQQATAQAWGEPAPFLWDLRRLAIEYLAPAYYGDELEVWAWPAGSHDGLAVCGYETRRAGDGQAVTRAQAAWAWLDPESRRPAALPAPWQGEPPAGCTPIRPLRLAPDRLGGRAYRWRHAVRRYEAGAGGRANPVDLLHWFQEATYLASVEAGWPLERLLAAGCLVVQIRHDAEFYAPLAPGDQVEILSRVYELGRVRGTWRQEVYRGGELVALDYSAGAFVDLAGRPHPPPQAYVDALLGA